MINLIRFVTNPFDDEINISADNFHQFATDHRNRLVANNPGGVFNAIITVTNTVYAQYDVLHGSKTVEEALKKGASIQLTGSVKAILEDARTLEDQVSYLFKKDSAKYASFFPKGLTELNKATKGEWPGILTRLQTATAANAAAVGASVVATWADHKNNYSEANAEQTGKKGTVDDLRKQVLRERKAMARQMFINLHHIAIHFIDAPESLTSYFDQSIVERKQSSDSDGLGRLLFRVTTHNGDALRNVQVDIQDENSQNILMNLKTDDKGQLKTPSVPIGFYLVTFRLKDYVPRTQSFEVKDDGDDTYEVQLTRE